MDKAVEPGLVTVTGLVVPWEWDVQGKDVVAVALETDDEREYIVTDVNAVTELLKHRSRPVEVTGSCTRDERGRSLLFVTHCRTVDVNTAWGNEPGV